MTRGRLFLRRHHHGICEACGERRQTARYDERGERMRDGTTAGRWLCDKCRDAVRRRAEALGEAIAKLTREEVF